jgi:putative ABC transport system substrate-binding protein
MRRAALICVMLATLSPTYAEAAERIWRVGVLSLVDPIAVPSVILPYLAKRGFVEGRNLVVDIRVGPEEKMPEIARAMVGGRPDAILALSDWALYAARAATSTIPIIVSPMGADPVLTGVAASWARPGGNVTGLSLIAAELEFKRLSLMRDALPSVRRVATLANHRKEIESGILRLRKTAAEVGLELVDFWVDGPEDYPAAFEAMRGAGAEALLIVPTPETGRDTGELATLALKYGLPTIGGFRENAKGGLLIGYGPSLRELAQQAASYVERILKGEPAGELPFQGPTRLDFAINMKTAKTLGLTIPPSLLVGADEVIE